MLNTGHFFVIGTALLWAMLPLVLKFQLNTLAALDICFIRFAIAWLFLAVFYLIKAPPAFKIFKRPSKLLLAAASLLTFNYWSYVKGVEESSPENAQIFIQIGPLLFAFMGVFYFKEKLNKTQFIGLFVALSGLFLFYKRNILLAGQNIQQYNVGILIIIAAAVAWAFFAVFQKLLISKGHSPQHLNFFIFGAACVLLLPFCRFNTWMDLSSTDYWILLYLGLNTLLAYGFLAEGIKRIPAAEASMIITLNPLLTLLLIAVAKYWDLLPWMEALDLGVSGWIGAILLVLGVMVVLSQKNKKTALSTK